MEEKPCRKRRLPIRFRRWKKKRTTPSGNGRSGWSYGNANWTSISRRSVRQRLRLLAQHLRNRRAIRRWMKEANNL